jgi:predicted ATP-dependent endonuclease of OLD family
MKIKSLYIKNFRSISLIDVSDLPDFVMIVGENGIGKSSIFDAIRFAKTMVAPYAQSDIDYWHERQRLTRLLQIGQEELIIRIGFELETDAERKLIEGNIPSLQVTYTAVNGLQTACPSPLMGLLRKWQAGGEVGVIEYIPANRVFQEGELSLQNAQSPDTEDFLFRRLTEVQNKYQDAKQRFVNDFLHDMLLPDEPKVFPTMKELIETLLEKSVNIGFDKVTRAPRIEIESFGGFVDVDTLSAGQRELFMTYVSLMALKLTKSIILFDEPDLHLHATLQRKVLQHLMELAKTNQLFVATHALEMISEAPEKNIYHLSTYQGGSQLVNLSAEKDKIEIFKKLGVSKYTFVNFRKVVFLEGDSDYRIIKDVTTSYNLRYEYIEGVSKATPEILENASQIESFYMIRDKDFYDDDEIAKDEAKYQNRVRYLKRRQIENYILDDEALFEVMKKIDEKSFASKDELIEALFKISELQFEQTVADYYVFKNPKDIHAPEVKVKDGETAETALGNAFAVKVSRMKDAISKLNSEVSSIRAELKKEWKETWKAYCSGRDVLRSLASKYGKGKSFEDIRDMVSVIWDVKKTLPQDLHTIINEIASS